MHPGTFDVKLHQHEKLRKTSLAEHLHATKGSSHKDLISGCGDAISVLEQHQGQ